MSTVDIDRDAAHDAAQRELSKPIYPRGSLTDLLSGWLEDLLYRIQFEGSSIPGGWLTLTVLLIILAIAAVVAVRVAMRTMRTNRGHDAALFGSGTSTAAEHRATARRFAADGDWAAAIRHRLRAVARYLEETAVLQPVPGRTATELARDAGSALPALAPELRRAAEAFNDVAYGERPATEAAYRTIADLDDHLCSGTAVAATDAAPPDDADGWVGVR